MKKENDSEHLGAILDIIHWAIQGRAYFLSQQAGGGGVKNFFDCCDQATREVLERTKKMGITE